MSIGYCRKYATVRENVMSRPGLTLTLGAGAAAAVLAVTGPASGERASPPVPAGKIAFRQGSSIVVTRLDGSLVRTIEMPAKSTAFAWSPDGRALAVVAQSGTHHLRVLVADVYAASKFSEVARVDATSPSPSQILYLPDATPPAWSPDGRALAFVARVSAREDRLYVADVRDHSAREVARVRSRDGRMTGLSDVSQPAWSPDSAKLLFVDADERLYFVRTDGLGLRQLTSTATCGPTFAPNGRHLAYLVSTARHAVAGCAGTVGMGNFANDDLLVRDVDGGPARRLSRQAFGAPSWSPNSQRIAYPYRCVGLPANETECEVQVRELTGRAIATFGGDRKVGPSFSEPFGVILAPDETHVVFGGDGGLFSASLSTRAVRTLMRGGADVYATSPAGHLIAFRYYESASHRTGLSIYSTTDGTIFPVKLTPAARRLVQGDFHTIALSVYLE